MPPPAAGMSAAYAREQLLTLLAPVVARTGHDLEDVTVTAAGRRSVVRVVVDADAGVDHDAVAEISRAVSARLDEDTVGGAAFAGPYVLEVSSPGVDRPLCEPRHWRRAAGRLVEVAVDGTGLTGRIISAGEDGVLLEVAGDQRELSWSQLGTGRVQVEFNRRTELGKEG